MNFNIFKMKERDFEEKSIDNFKKMHYEYMNTSEIMQLRNGDKTEIFLLKILEEQIETINKKYKPTKNNINKVIRELRNVMEYSNLLERNMHAHKILVEGVKVYDEIENRTFTYKIIDFDNYEMNQFIVTNQFQMFSTNPTNNGKIQIPDLVIFINGIPISIIELKNPQNANEQILQEAWNQIQVYQEYMSNLFTFNFVNVISNFYNTKIGTITSNFENYLRWKNWKNHEEKYIAKSDTMEELIEAFFNHKTLLDILKNYVVYFNKKSKIIPRYFQYYTTKILVNQTIFRIQDCERKKISGIKKIGTIWHTQGSGKSLLMLFIVHNLMRNSSNLLNKISIVIITDRIDLDCQLFNTFSNANDYLPSNPEQVESRSDLKTKLKNIQQNGIFFTTIQKFENTIGCLSQRDDIFILTDEAHRSHNNLDEQKYNAKIKKIGENKSFAITLRKAFPNAMFTGLTGTPLMKNDERDTIEIFGPYLSKYTMTEATADGFIVPINYESSKLNISLDDEQLKTLDAEYENKTQEIIENTEIKNQIVRNLRKKVLQVKKFLASDERIKKITDHFINHYEKRKNILEWKAMFVCHDRELAFKYYKSILKSRPEWKDKMKLVVTSNNKDSVEMKNLIGNKIKNTQITNEFRESESQIKILIVVDMLLTGYDVPSLDVMYIDKVMKMHNLMQAVARVNRKYQSLDNRKVKAAGLIVDYIGIFNRLEEALKYYTNFNLSHNDINFNESDQYIDIDKIKNDLIKTMKGIYQNYFYNLKNIEDNKIIELMLNQLFKNQKENDFIEQTKKIRKLLASVASNLDQKTVYQMNLLLAVRGELIKAKLSNISFIEPTEKLVEKIQNSLIIGDFDSNFGNNIISFQEIIKLIEEKVQDNHNLESKHLESERISKLLATLIKNCQNIAEVKKKKLSEYLWELLKKFKSGHLSYEEFIKQLRPFSEDIIKENNEQIDGLDSNEKIFYTIISNIDFTNHEFCDEQLKDITRKIYNVVKNINRNWYLSNTIRSDVRYAIKNILRENNYPPKSREERTKEIIEEIDNLIEQNRINLTRENSNE